MTHNYNSQQLVDEQAHSIWQCLTACAECLHMCSTGALHAHLNLIIHRHHLSRNNYTILTSIHTCHYRDTHTDTCNIRRSRVATTTSRCCCRTRSRIGSSISTCHRRGGRADHVRGGRKAGHDRGRGGFWLWLGLCKRAIEQVVYNIGLPLGVYIHIHRYLAEGLKIS